MIISFKATAKYTPYASAETGTGEGFTGPPRPAGHKKVVVIFDIIKDYKETETKIFLLPDKQGQFKTTLLKLFDTYSNIMPKDLTKERFKSDFVEWTLKQNFATVDVNVLNSHYELLFEADIIDPLSAQLKKMYELYGTLQGKAAQNIAAYEKSKSEGGAGSEPMESALREAPDTPDTSPPDKLTVTPGPSPAKSDTQKPKRDVSNLSSAAKQRVASQPDGGASLAGILGDKLLEPFAGLRQFDGDVVIKGSNNAWCLLTRDLGRYGVDGSTGAGAVWLGAGLSPHDTKTEVADGNSGPGSNKPVEKRPTLTDDAAFLYLSQKSDPDSLLGKVAGGTYKKVSGPRTGESFGALKADGVAIIARKSGIRLITGTDRKATDGGKMTSTFGIDLIAGNSDKDLQPMVKGDNLVTYLAQLSDSVTKVGAVLYNFMTAQNTFNAKLMVHQHYCPTGVGLASLAGNPTLPISKSIPDEKLVVSGMQKVLQTLLNQINAVNQALGQINNDFNALQRIGAYSIRSSKNRVN